MTVGSEPTQPQAQPRPRHRRGRIPGGRRFFCLQPQPSCDTQGRALPAPFTHLACLILPDDRATPSLVRPVGCSSTGLLLPKCRSHDPTGLTPSHPNPAVPVKLAPSLSVQGFKILLDLVATAGGKLRVVEVPYSFGTRLHGESKLDSMVVLDFLGLVLAKMTHDLVSLRFLLFALVGSVGLFVHLVTLYILSERYGVEFAESQAIAAFVAMTGNFFLNNRLTYRDQRLKGFSIVRGLLLFYLVCGVGLLANVGVAFSVYDQEPIWWLAGAAGALMGVVWNYAVSSLFVWRAK